MNVYSFLIAAILKHFCASQCFISILLSFISITDYRLEVSPSSLMHKAHHGETEETKIEPSLLSSSSDSTDLYPIK